MASIISLFDRKTLTTNTNVDGNVHSTEANALEVMTTAAIPFAAGKFFDIVMGFTAWGDTIGGATLNKLVLYLDGVPGIGTVLGTLWQSRSWSVPEGQQGFKMRWQLPKPGVGVLDIAPGSHTLTVGALTSAGETYVIAGDVGGSGRDQPTYLEVYAL